MTLKTHHHIFALSLQTVHAIEKLLAGFNVQPRIQVFTRSSGGATRVWNSLDPDRTRRYVGVWSGYKMFSKVVSNRQYMSPAGLGKSKCVAKRCVCVWGGGGGQKLACVDKMRRGVQGVRSNPTPAPPPPPFFNILWKWNNLVSVRPNYFIFVWYLSKNEIKSARLHMSQWDQIISFSWNILKAKWL